MPGYSLTEIQHLRQNFRYAIIACYERYEATIKRELLTIGTATTIERQLKSIQSNYREQFLQARSSLMEHTDTRIPTEIEATISMGLGDTENTLFRKIQNYETAISLGFRFTEGEMFENKQALECFQQYGFSAINFYVPIALLEHEHSLTETEQSIQKIKDLWKKIIGFQNQDQINYTQGLARVYGWFDQNGQKLQPSPQEAISFLEKSNCTAAALLLIKLCDEKEFPLKEGDTLAHRNAEYRYRIARNRTLFDAPRRLALIMESEEPFRSFYLVRYYSDEIIYTTTNSQHLTNLPSDIKFIDPISIQKLPKEMLPLFSRALYRVACHYRNTRFPSLSFSDAYRKTIDLLKLNIEPFRSFFLTRFLSDTIENFYKFISFKRHEERDTIFDWKTLELKLQPDKIEELPGEMRVELAEAQYDIARYYGKCYQEIDTAIFRVSTAQQSMKTIEEQKRFAAEQESLWLKAAADNGHGIAYHEWLTKYDKEQRSEEDNTVLYRNLVITLLKQCDGEDFSSPLFRQATDLAVDYMRKIPIKPLETAITASTDPFHYIHKIIESEDGLFHTTLIGMNDAETPTNEELALIIQNLGMLIREIETHLKIKEKPGTQKYNKPLESQTSLTDMYLANKARNISVDDLIIACDLLNANALQEIIEASPSTTAYRAIEALKLQHQTIPRQELQQLLQNGNIASVKKLLTLFGEKYSVSPYELKNLPNTHQPLSFLILLNIFLQQPSDITSQVSLLACFRDTISTGNIFAFNLLLKTLDAKVTPKDLLQLTAHQGSDAMVKSILYQLAKNKESLTGQPHITALQKDYNSNMGYLIDCLHYLYNYFEDEERMYHSGPQERYRHFSRSRPNSKEHGVLPQLIENSNDFPVETVQYAAKHFNRNGVSRKQQEYLDRLVILQTAFNLVEEHADRQLIIQYFNLFVKQDEQRRAVACEAKFFFQTLRKESETIASAALSHTDTVEMPTVSDGQENLFNYEVG